MTDMTFEIIKIGAHWVMRAYWTTPGDLPVCISGQRIKATEKEYCKLEMRKRGYCYQA